MQKSSKSLIILLMVIVILAVAYFGAYSQWQTLGQTRASFDVSKEANDKLKKAQADASSFLNQYENSKDEAQLANRALPMGKPQVPILLDNFSRMVAESGLAMTQINIVEQELSAEVSAAPNSVKPIDIDAQLSGTYEAFNDLLLRTQRNLRLMDLVSFTISESQQEGNSGQSFSYTLKFRTYYQQ
jgi:Tfp pilus assembly protein PilO